MSRFEEKLNKVNQLISQQQFSQALQQSRKLTRERPAMTRAWLSRSEAARSLGEAEEAVRSSQKAATLEPGSGFAQAQYARCLLPDADYRELGPILQRGIDLRHESPWATEILGSCAVGMHDWPLARRYYQRLVDDHGTNAQYRHMLAVAANVLGDVELATKQLKRIIRQQPEFGPAYWTLLDVAPERFTEEMEKQVAALCDDPRLNENQKLYFYHTQARLCDRKRDPAAAVRWYSRANAVKRSQVRYSGETDKALSDAIRQQFSEAGSAKEAAAEGPVFVVGLPRSGSTLVEQLLVNSGQISAPGELRDLEVLLARAAGNRGLPVMRPEDVAALKAAGMDGLGDEYRARVSSRVTAGQRVVDKNPFNFRYAGMIFETMPEARVVHVHKTPLEACLGNFRHLFASVAPWSYSVDELVLYFRLYRDLMAHWEALYPGRILHIAYDDLIRKPKQTGRTLFRHCGLRWEKGMDELSGPREIRSASVSQVRRGLNRESLDTWKDYGPHMQTLYRRLESGGLL